MLEAAFGRADEARLVEELRRENAAAIELVAVADGAVVGHVLASRMQRPDNTLGLAPLAVFPVRQRQGIGALLMRRALERARADAVSGVFLLGDARYYGRFGFTAEAARGFASAYTGPHFQYLALTDTAPRQGTAAYAPPFARL